MNDALERARVKIRGRGMTLVLPEAEDERIAAAARVLADEDLARPILLRAGDEFGASLSLVDIVRSRRERMTETMARRLLQRPLYRGAAMVAAGGADAMLAGAINPTSRVIE